jgi:hypothetical protein
MLILPKIFNIGNLESAAMLVRLTSSVHCKHMQIAGSVWWSRGEQSQVR